MPPLERLQLLIILLGGFALAMPWLAWARLRALERRSGRALLVRGVNGEQAARIVLLRGEIDRVPVDETPDFLGDGYAAGEPALKLAQRTYFGRTLFAVVRAAGIAGHGLQHRDRDRRVARLGRIDGILVLWGNVWPILLLGVMLSPGRMGGLAAFAVLAIGLGIAQALTHATVADAVRRGRAELDGARLLDGHPAGEIADALEAARLEHLAAPAKRTLWGALRTRD
ncbi:MAG: zinc metallopeptidase [Opitutales bacterium]